MRYQSLGGIAGGFRQGHRCGSDAGMAVGCPPSRRDARRALQRLGPAINNGVAEKKILELQNLEAIRGVILGSAAPCLWAGLLRRGVAE